MKKIRKPLKKLVEAIQVEGTELIGTDKGIDLFKINSYEASQQFVCHDNNRAAGQAFIQNENIFNDYAAPGRNHSLYFFTFENTNQVIAAMLSNQTWTLKLSDNIRFELNYAYEDFNNNTTYNLHPRYSLPLHLLPEINISRYEFNNQGFIYRGDTLYALVNEFYNDTNYNNDTITIPDFITTISSHAISEEISPLDVLNEVVIPETVTTIAPQAFVDVRNISVLRNLNDIPETFSDNWFIGDNVTVNCLDGELNEETLAQIQDERNNAFLNSYEEEIQNLNTDVTTFNFDLYNDYTKSNFEEINNLIDVLFDRFNVLPAIVKNSNRPNIIELKNNLSTLKQDADLWNERYEHYVEEQRELASRNKFKYKVKGNEIVITGSNYNANVEVQDLRIPEEIEGKKVTEISSYAFYGNNTIKNIFLPKTIEKIGKHAFNNIWRVNVPKNVYTKLNLDNKIYVLRITDRPSAINIIE